MELYIQIGKNSVLVRGLASGADIVGDLVQIVEPGEVFEVEDTILTYEELVASKGYMKI